MCFRHENGGSEAWQSYDVTPANEHGEVKVFDVIEGPEHFTLALTIHKTERSNLFTFVCKKIAFDPLSMSSALVHCISH